MILIPNQNSEKCRKEEKGKGRTGLDLEEARWRKRETQQVTSMECHKFPNLSIKTAWKW